MRSEEHISCCHTVSGLRGSDVISFLVLWHPLNPHPRAIPFPLCCSHPWRLTPSSWLLVWANRRKAHAGGQREGGREKLGYFFQISPCFSAGGVNQWPWKISGGASPFQDCSSCPAPLLPSWAPALTPVILFPPSVSSAWGWEACQSLGSQHKWFPRPCQHLRRLSLH